MATKSDYYTHIMDIPPQYGSGQTVEEAGVRIYTQITTHTYQITAHANMSDYCTHTHQGYSAGVRLKLLVYGALSYGA
jgi:hypothetical protein